MRSRLAALLSAALAVAADAPPTFPPPKSVGPVETFGQNVGRTMRLLHEGKPVRVLFYGQSITEQKWARLVADDLKRRFPRAKLTVENRAIGGHSAQLLVKCAEADVAPFRPDLVIFHVYGSHTEYENVLKLIRSRTTAEILQQNDHVTKPEDLIEEADPAKLAPGGKAWTAFMNHRWLPGLAKTHQTEYCDQRGVWKQYLTDYDLKPAALLNDAVHLNAHGEFLMAECVKAHLRYAPELGPSPAEAWVTERPVAAADRQGNAVRVAVEGSRVVALVKGGGTLAVTVDGRAPSAISETYAVTRTSPYPGMNWPALLRVGHEKPLAAERWTLTLDEVSDDCATCKFHVVGSVTGADGEGTSKERFVSKSGRVVIEPGDWNLAYGRRVRKDGPAPQAGFAVKWKAVCLSSDTVTVPAGDELVEVEVVQGLANGPHTLELTGDGAANVVGLRVHRPPGK